VEGVTFFPRKKVTKEILPKSERTSMIERCVEWTELPGVNLGAEELPLDFRQRRTCPPTVVADEPLAQNLAQISTPLATDFDSSHLPPTHLP